MDFARSALECGESSHRFLPTGYNSARDRQLQKLINLLRAVDVHDAVPQFLALILANDVAAERGEFHRDFFLGHRIARIAFGHIDTSGMRFAIVGCDGHAARLELGKKRFELFIRDNFYLVHDWNQRLIEHPFFFELQGRYHAIHKSDSHAVRQ